MSRPAPTSTTSSGGGRRPFFRRRKTCPFTGPNAPKIDYKDVKLLQRYISERGKIVPSRITAVSAAKAARTRDRDQARAVPRASALRHSLSRHAALAGLSGSAALVFNS